MALLARLTHSRRAGQATPKPAIPWYEMALAVAAVASYGLTRLVLSVIKSAGGFYVHGVIGGTGLAPLSAIPRQLLWTGQNLLYLFGANWWGVPRQEAAFGYLHLAGVALALCGLLLGIWGLFARADRVTQTLAAGILVTLAAGAFGTHMAPIQGAHEIAIVLPFSAVLAGRLIGPWLAARGSRLIGGAGVVPRKPAELIGGAGVVPRKPAEPCGRPPAWRGSPRRRCSPSPGSATSGRSGTTRRARPRRRRRRPSPAGWSPTT